ncbi:alpha/beta hydrolase [Polaribacter sp.]|uniref:alpha/beta hydrolase n=1 Tax=Polaribacter sp. TaxID=1920175 RepID=UPI0040474D35
MIQYDKKCNLKFVLIAFFMCSSLFSQEELVYKQLDSIALKMYIYSPENIDTSKKHPAIVFFFGGGWNEGSVKQFEPHAKYFAKRGLVCFLVDYRVKKRHETTPFESLKDAKSAMRFIRQNAINYHIDSEKIVASGGSAGGQLAAATALISAYNETTDDETIDCKPNALVLFNPAIDNGPGGVGFDRVKDDYQNFSPIHNIKKGTPPTIIFLGTKDALIPVETINKYQNLMKKVGSICEVHLYEGKTHGFFNYNKFDNYKDTLLKADAFLQSIGYLNVNPKIEVE